MELPSVTRGALEKGTRTRVQFFARGTAERLKSQEPASPTDRWKHVLAQVPDLKGFVCGMRTNLASQGGSPWTFPNLIQLVERNQLDAKRKLVGFLIHAKTSGEKVA